MRLIAERIISVCKTDKLDEDAPASAAPAGAAPAAGAEAPPVPCNRSKTLALPLRLSRQVTRQAFARGRSASASGVEQQPTMRRRASISKDKERYYIQGEYANKDVALPPPNEANGKEFHVYVPPHVPGGEALMAEVAEKLSIEVRLTNDVAKLDQCHHFLLYLTGKTWTSGAATEALADEIRTAMDKKMPILLAHEMIGFGGQAGRHGCEFADFFSCDEGTTPDDLLRNNIYGSIAVALKGGQWRAPSMVILAEGLAAFEAPDAAAANAVSRRGPRQLLSTAQAALHIPSQVPRLPRLPRLTLKRASCRRSKKPGAEASPLETADLRHVIAEGMESVSGDSNASGDGGEFNRDGEKPPTALVETPVVAEPGPSGTPALEPSSPPPPPSPTGCGGVTYLPNVPLSPLSPAGEAPSGCGANAERRSIGSSSSQLDAVLPALARVRRREQELSAARALVKSMSIHGKDFRAGVGVEPRVHPGRPPQPGQSPFASPKPTPPMSPPGSSPPPDAAPVSSSEAVTDVEAGAPGQDLGQRTSRTALPRPIPRLSVKRTLSSGRRGERTLHFVQGPANAPRRSEGQAAAADSSSEARAGRDLPPQQLISGLVQGIARTFTPGASPRTTSIDP